MNFNEIYKEFYPKIYKKVCIMIGDDEIAKDLTNDIFIKVNNRLSKYDTTYKFSTWINTVANNHVIDYIRSRNRKPVQQEINDDVLNIPEELDNSVYYDEISENIYKILENRAYFSNRSATIFIMFYKESKTYKEIAETLKLSEFAIKTSLYKTRLKIKQFIKKDVL